MNAELQITLTDGRVNVTGPLLNKVLCYGMLMQAMDCVRDFDPKKQSQANIIPVPAHVIGNRNGGGKPF